MHTNDLELKEVIFSLVKKMVIIIILVMTLDHLLTSLNKALAQVTVSEDRVDYSDTVGFDFYEELKMPEPKEDGRGEAIEDLQSNYGEACVNDSYLTEDVIHFRRWEWERLYSSLDQKVKEEPEYLDTYRLQAEIYLVNQHYKEALSQIDQILRKKPTDIHALTLSIIAAKASGEDDQFDDRLVALASLSDQAHDQVIDLLEFTEANDIYHADYGPDPQTDIQVDAIAVFGQSPEADGSPSTGMIARLAKAKEMAERYPQADIVLSGGPVRYEYAEADVMAQWLIDNGISPDRLILDTQARDTPGNAMGMVEAFESIDAHNILAIATLHHLPRATTVLKVYGQSIGYDMTIDSAGGGRRSSKAKNESERLYTYVNAFRAAGLFTKTDFEKFDNKVE